MKTGKAIAYAVAIALALSPGALAQAARSSSHPAAAESSDPPLAGRAASRSSYLGVYVRDITPDRAHELKLSQEEGAEITMVDHDAPAGKAGLKENDVILTFNGTPVQSVEQLRRLIRETPAGRPVTLVISRDGQPLTIHTQLASRTDYARKGMTIEVPEIHVPEMEFAFPAFTVLQYSRRVGLVVENLTPQLGEYFGVRDGEGVLVRSVEKGSRAEAAGFKAGDVITRVAGNQIRDSSDWNRIIRQNANQNLPVNIIRDHKEQTLILPLANPVAP